MGIEIVNVCNPLHGYGYISKKVKGSKMEKRILVMDDDKTMRDMMEIMLSKLNHRIDFAVDGDQAVKKYSENTYDLIILDLTIRSGKGGLEAFQEIHSFDPSVKAVIVSGQSKSPLVLNPEASGFYGSLTKPFKMEELHELVESVLTD